MAYSELIKNFTLIRDYMRQFYVYGFRSRGEYDAKSERTYDNERRRIESWLGDYMSFRQDAGGKQVFLSVDSRAIEHNPLHQAFRARSFTDRDITLHFYILDLLCSGQAMTARQMLEQMDERYLCHFPEAWVPDISTLRKKLSEYESLGLLVREKRGREILWRRTESGVVLDSWRDALDFYTEETPLGVIGSYLLARLPRQESSFRFKHHYLLHTLDAQVLLAAVEAIEARQTLTLTLRSARSGLVSQQTVCPLGIHISAQTGRQYLLCWNVRLRRFRFVRLDGILEAAPAGEAAEFDLLRRHARQVQEHLWGVSLGDGGPIEHLEMVIRFESWETHIPARLRREKRVGTVEMLDDSTCRFTADVYDAREMLPWIRTFIGRIVSLECSNPEVVATFRADLKRMRELYGGTEDAVL